MQQKLLAALILVFCVSGVYATDYSLSEDFEDTGMSGGWYITAGAGALTTARNHTPGGQQSDHLTTGSTSFTTLGGYSTAGVLDYWVYTDGSGDPTYGGYYDVAEIFLKDDNNAIVAQLYIRPYGVRAYSPSPYQPTIPGSENQYLTGQWNHITIEYDYVNGVLNLTVNSWSYSFAGFGLTDGATGNGVYSFTWTHNNRNGADIYLDDVNLVDNTPQPPPPPKVRSMITPMLLETFDRGFWLGDWYELPGLPNLWNIYLRGKGWNTPSSLYPGDIEITDAKYVSAPYSLHFQDNVNFSRYIQKTTMPGPEMVNWMDKGYIAWDFFIESYEDATLEVTVSGSSGVMVQFGFYNNYAGAGVGVVKDWVQNDWYDAHPYTLGQWNSAVIKFDTQTYSLYINGIEQCSGKTVGGSIPNTAANVIWKAYNNHESYLDNIVIGVDGPELTNMDMTAQGLDLDFTELPHVESNTLGAILWKDNMDDPWNIGPSYVMHDTDTQWIDQGDTDRTDPRDPSVKKRFYKIGSVLPTACEALPGYYVTSMKYVTDDGTDTGEHNVALGMYTFDGTASSGTVDRKYWIWSEVDHADTTFNVDANLIGTGIDTPPGHTDEFEHVQSVQRFVDGESGMETDTGTWTLTGRRIAINWSSGESEKWYITWEDSYTLYKIELYEASYAKPGTLFYLNGNDLTETGRNTGHIANAGFGFGSNQDFSVARPMGDEMRKELRGASLSFNFFLNAGYNGWGVPTAPSTAGYYQYHVTDENVLRWISTDAGAPTIPHVYHYVSTPENSTGNMARRIVRQYAHDSDNDGNIADMWGHRDAALQVIDAAGRYRGTVSVEYYWTVEYAARYHIDVPDNQQTKGVLPEL